MIKKITIAIAAISFLILGCSNNQKNKAELQGVQLQDGHIFINEVRPTFEWDQAEEDLYYTIQISDKEDFSMLYLEQTVYDNGEVRIITPLSLNREQYFIRLGSKSEENETISEWSDPVRFELRLTPPSQTEKNLSHAMDRKTVIHLQEYEDTIMISYQIASKPNFNYIISSEDYLNEDLEDGTIILENIDPRRVLYIRFQAVYPGSGNTTEWSEAYPLNPLTAEADPISGQLNNEQRFLSLAGDALWPDGSHHMESPTLVENTQGDLLRAHLEFHSPKIVMTQFENDGHSSILNEIAIPREWSNMRHISKAHALSPENNAYLFLLSQNEIRKGNSIILINGEKTSAITINGDILSSAADMFMEEHRAHTAENVLVNDALGLDDGTILLCGNYSDARNNHTTGWIAVMDSESLEWLHYHESSGETESSYDALLRSDEGEIFILGFDGKSLIPTESGELKLTMSHFEQQNSHGSVLFLRETELPLPADYLNIINQDSYPVCIKEAHMLRDMIIFSIYHNWNTVYDYHVSDGTLNTYELFSSDSTEENFWSFNIHKIIVNRDGDRPLIGLLGAAFGIPGHDANDTKATLFNCLLDQDSAEIVSFQQNTFSSSLPLSVYLNGERPEPVEQLGSETDVDRELRLYLEDFPITDLVGTWQILGEETFITITETRDSSLMYNTGIVVLEDHSNPEQEIYFLHLENKIRSSFRFHDFVSEDGTVNRSASEMNDTGWEIVNIVEKNLIIQTYNNDGIRQREITLVPIERPSPDINFTNMAGNWVNVYSEKFLILDADGNVSSGWAKNNGTWYGMDKFILVPISENQYQLENNYAYADGNGPKWKIVQLSGKTLIIQEQGNDGSLILHTYQKRTEIPEIIWK